jgi:hypothetical protein
MKRSALLVFSLLPVKRFKVRATTPPVRYQYLSSPPKVALDGSAAARHSTIHARLTQNA